VANSLQDLLTQIGLAMAPLRALKTPAQAVAFFRQLGYEVPAASVGSALNDVSARANDLANTVRTLAAATSDVAIATALAEALARLVQIVNAIGQLHVQIKAGGGGGLPNIDDFPRRLTDLLVLDLLNQRRPGLHDTLHLLGLIENEPAPAAGQASRRLNWERFSQLIEHPGQIVNDVYRWDTDFDTTKFLTRLAALMRTEVMAGGLYPQSSTIQSVLGNANAGLPELRYPLFQKGVTPETFAQFGVTFTPVEAQGGQKTGIALLPYLTGASSFAFDVCDRGQLTFESTADIRGVGIVVRPPFDAQGLLNLTGSFHAAIKVREKPEKAQEIIVIGTPGGTRLSLQGLGIEWYASGAREKLDVGFEAQIDAVRLVVAPGEGDGFLQKVLSGVHVDAQAAVAFGMSLQSGFTFRGGGKLALDIGTHLDVGPIHVTGLRLALAPSGEGIALESGANLKFDLGPMKAVAENIGLRSTLRFTPGNLGPANLDFGFMPPTGIGLTLDAGGFKGGGYLRFDPANGEYAGALELDFNGLFSVKAIALINTKMPDGSPGFSLLVLITAEFTPIQLGFGFTLNGVGGLFGLNRTIFVNALVEGIRTNAIASILFPQDVIANITRIISDIKQFFPPQEDHFVVGPMGKLGWGTPTIITAELGLLLDLPKPMLAIVGILRAVLPAEEAAILKLQVNFIGVLDLDRGYLFFRADLFDSRLLLFTITGSLAFMVSWGEEQLFALSVGGFHPDFHDIPTIPALPDGFRNMARIGISLLSDDNPRLKVESYFAVTSNTVQFGAKVELYAAAAGFNIYGFLGYDVLFQFDPFYFIAKLYGGIALRQDDDVIAGINVTAQLSGPTPWDARGTASLTILFFEISVDFHVAWGDPPSSVDQKTEDLLALLKRQLGDTRNWRAELPPENHLHVSLRTIEPPTTGEVPLVIHPAGVLTFTERSLPLGGYLIEKFGTRKPLADNKFTLSGANAGGLAIPADYQGVREQFAISQFTELNDSEKLSRRSFEPLPSGFSLTGTSNLQATLPVTREVIYELSYLRRKPIRIEFSGLVRLALKAYDRLVKGSAVRQSALAKQQTRQSLNAPPQVSLPADQFTVASVADLTGYAAAGESARTFHTEAEAYQHQKELIRSNPALAGQIQVVSQFELAS
jgi:hypothetical protein